jgi:hypothetical protein
LWLADKKEYAAGIKSYEESIRIQMARRMILITEVHRGGSSLVSLSPRRGKEKRPLANGLPTAFFVLTFCVYFAATGSKR